MCLSKGQNGGAHVPTSTCGVYPSGKQYMHFEISKAHFQSWLEVWGWNIFCQKIPIHWDCKASLWVTLWTMFPKPGEEEVMVSVRGTEPVFGMSGGEHSHKAWACLLQASGGYAGHKGLTERWQHSGGGGGAALAAGSPLVTVQQELQSGASCCSVAGGHDRDNSSSRVVSGLSRQKPLPCCIHSSTSFSPISHFSCELEPWDLFSTRAVAVSGSSGLALVHQSNKETGVSGKGGEAAMQWTWVQHEVGEVRQRHHIWHHWGLLQKDWGPLIWGTQWRYLPYIKPYPLCLCAFFWSL